MWARFAHFDDFNKSPEKRQVPSKPYNPLALKQSTPPAKAIPTGNSLPLRWPPRPVAGLKLMHPLCQISIEPA
ncbi:MAG: hypothetical protein CMJ72_10295 [Planctomycetaceae bacterium]|nr:hypothetical protein [Planctomycetaceae bacterium]HCK41110.1 hypothetical protein [Planctomycetaceae bacterium]